MKKTLILFVGLSLALASCSSDDNGGNSINASIVCTWELKNLNSKSDFGFATSTGQGKDYNAFMTFTDSPNEVSSGRTVVLEQTIYINGTPMSTSEDLISFENTFGTGQWELSGNTLTMSSDNHSVVVTVTKLTSNTLIFTYDPDETVRITYQFSK